jgi:enediyne biosynthesis thioesterase
MFLREHAPDLLDELERGLALVTTRVACEYLAELRAFDEIVVRMSLAGLTRNQVTMRFEYYRARPDGEELVARGEQQAACMRRVAGGVEPTPFPHSLQRAFKQYESA